MALVLCQFRILRIRAVPHYRMRLRGGVRDQQYDDLQRCSKYFGGCKLEKFSCEKCGMNYEIYYKTDGENQISEYLYVVIRLRNEVLLTRGTPPAET